MDFNWLPQALDIGKWIVDIVGGLGILGVVVTPFLPKKTTTTIGYIIGTINRVLLRQKSLKDTKAGKMAKTAACIIEGWYQALKEKAK